MTIDINNISQFNIGINTSGCNVDRHEVYTKMVKMAYLDNNACNKRFPESASTAYQNRNIVSIDFRHIITWCSFCTRPLSSPELEATNYIERFKLPSGYEVDNYDLRLSMMNLMVCVLLVTSVWLFSYTFLFLALVTFAFSKIFYKPDAKYKRRAFELFDKIARERASLMNELHDMGAKFGRDDSLNRLHYRKMAYVDELLNEEH